MRKICILLIWILNCMMAYSQEPFYLQYNTTNGLPSDEVYDVEIDSTGLLWIATDRGVATYDGYDFRVYTKQDGLQDNTIFEIFVQSNGDIWFSGYNGSLTIYRDGAFFPYAYQDEIDEYIAYEASGWIRQLIELDSGNIYMSYKRHNHFEIIELDNQLKPEIKPLNCQTSLIVDDILISTFDDNGNLWMLNTIFYDLNKLNLLTRNSTVDIISEYNPQAIIDVGGRYITINDTQRGILTFDSSTTATTLLSHIQPTSMNQDNNGGVWMSTLTDGIIYIPSFDSQYYNFNQLGVNNRALCMDNSQSHLVVGLTNSTAGIIDQESRMSTFLLDKDQSVLIDNISRNKQGDSLFILNMIFTEYNRELVYKMKSGYNKKQPFLLANHSILLSNVNGAMLVSNQSDYYQASLIHTPQLVGLNTPLKLVKQRDSGQIYLATLEKLFVVEDYNFDDIGEIKREPDTSIDRVQDIEFIDTNYAWVATLTDGLFLLRDDQIIDIDSLFTMDHLVINAIATYEDILLIATTTGLVSIQYSIDEENIYIEELMHYGDQDGLSSNFINDVHYWNDKIWLATNNGVNQLSPSSLYRSFGTCEVNIDGVYVMDSLWKTSNTLLHHDQNDISIRYTAIRFNKDETKSFYRYKLERNNENEDWEYTNERLATFNNLQPGKYLFSVEAVNKSGQWSQSTTSHPFTIRPHYTDTLWFTILQGLAIASVLILGFLYYINRNRKAHQNRIQLKEIELKSKSSELSALRNQMNPHFVFNSLNSIQNFIFKKDVKRANYYLSKFSVLIRKSLEYSRLEYITLADEVAFLKDYLDLEQMRFPESFEVHFSIDSDLELDQCAIPALMIQPIVENAVKHAFVSQERKGRLEINIRRIDNLLLEVVITDNGPGIQEEEQMHKSNPIHKSLSIGIIKARIRLLNEVNPSAHADISFKNIDENGETGLQVKLWIPYKGIE